MLSGGQCPRVRPELGVYLLGAIEPAQRSLVDQHLVACPACRAELAELAGLPSLLRRVPAETVEQLLADGTVPATPGPPLAVLLARMAAIRRRRWILAVAAALVTGIASASAVQALHAARPSAAAAPGRIDTAQAANPATGAWALVRYAAEPWGTELQVKITGIAAGTRCRLLVTGPRGQEVAAGGWYMTGGQNAAWYSASVPLKEPNIRTFQILTGSKILVTIPAS